MNIPINLVVINHKETYSSVLYRIGYLHIRLNCSITRDS